MNLKSLIEVGPPERLIGYWSIPALELKGIVGDLSLSKQPVLTLHAGLEIWRHADRKVPLISGITDMGYVLLYDSILLRGSLHVPGLAQIEAHPLVCIFGEGDELPVHKKWSFGVKGLETWWHASPVEKNFDQSDDSEVWCEISIKHPVPVRLNRHDDLPGIEVSHILGIPGHTLGQLTTSCWPFVNFNYPEAVDIDRFMKDCRSFLLLLSLLSGRRYSLSFAEVHEAIDDGGTSSKTMVFRQSSTSSDELERSPPFIGGRQIQDSFDRQWAAWIDNHDKIASFVSSLIRAGLNQELDEQTRLISCISALERLYVVLGLPQRVMSISNGKKLANRIVDILESEYDAEVIETIKLSLQFITQLPLRDRLRALFDRLPKEIGGQLKIQPNDFCEFLSHRTEIAHHRAGSLDRGIRLNVGEAADRLALLLHVTLLRILEVPDGVIESALTSWKNSALRTFKRLN